MDMADAAVIKQHLIDPEICIRCNTCEATCPVGAITHDVAQLRRRCGQVQPVHGLHLALPDRQHRQLAHDAARHGLQRRGAAGLGRAAGRTDAPSSWPPPASAPRRRRGARDRGRTGRRRRQPSGEAAFNSAPSSAPRCRPGRPRTPTPTSTARRRPRRRVTATVVGNVRVTEVGTRVRHPPHRARLRRHAVPGARRPVDRHRAAGRRRQRPAAPRAPVLDRQPAQRRAARLQQPVADDQARARGPPGPPGARRRQQLHVRPEGRRQGAGDRPLRHQLPDAQPPEEPHRDDLHRHRQRADARDDRVAAAAARQSASSRAAS